MSKTEKFGEAFKGGRGFPGVAFKDSYEKPANITCSSVILDYPESADRPGTSAVWLGVNKVRSHIMARDAHLVGLEVGDKKGWVDFPIPPEVLLQSSLHLNREQVQGLIDRLQEWLDTGSFSD